MPAANRILWFLVQSVLSLLVLIVPWYYLAPYLAAPVIAVAGELVQHTFVWVRGVEREGSVGTLITSLQVYLPQNGRLHVADLAPEVNYRTYGYGLALFWALLLASRPKHIVLKLALGTLVLIPSQAVGMCFRWLREALLITGPEVWSQTGLPRWVAEVIAYGYQFGFLMLTPLVPVLLWLAMDRGFVQQLWIETTLASVINNKAQ